MGKLLKYLEYVKLMYRVDRAFVVLVKHYTDRFDFGMGLCIEFRTVFRRLVYIYYF